MHLEIDYLEDRKQYFWNISDGPDGIDTHEGIANSLGEVMERVTLWRTFNALQYVKTK